MEKPEQEFLRNWSARVFDEAQLAQIREIEAHMVKYAMEGWRPMNIPPPQHELIIGSCEEGLVLMTMDHHGEWRTSLGQPHKPPRAWMPAPMPPKLNGNRNPLADPDAPLV